jgi:hypothetical protein
MFDPSFARGRANSGRALTAPVRFISALPVLLDKCAHR